MKKNISKIIAIGIGLSLMTRCLVTTFAAENLGDDENIPLETLTNKGNYVSLEDSIMNVQAISTKPILTLDKAINAAIGNSGKLALKSKEIKMYKNKMDLQDTKDDYYEVINEKVYDFPYDKLELLEKQTDQSKGFLQDQIASDITNKYNSIILKQMDINKLKTNLQIKTRDLEMLKKKVDIGLATNNQLDDKQIEVKSLEDDIKSKEDSIRNNMDYLGVLINMNLSDYTLDSNINYELFKIDNSIDNYINNKIDIYLKYNKKIIDLTKDYIDELEDDDIKDIPNESKVLIPDKSSSSFNTTNETTGEIIFDSNKYALALIEYEKKLTKYESYLDSNYSIEEAKVELDDSKKSLKKALNESYSILLDLENKINRLNEQIKSNNTKLMYAKSRVDMGLMTKNEYEAKVLENYDLEISLSNLINTYNNLKDTIQKPWIFSNNSL